MGDRKAGESVAISVVGGETARAFVPRSLPPDPPPAISAALRDDLDMALLELGRLDGMTSQIPDTTLFLYSYIRKEAVLSSQIEGTQSSLADLLLFELDGAPGAPLDDVREVSNYVAAMEHGLKRLRGGFPLCNRLLREIHRALRAKGRGSHKTPGEFRTTQNWIGGSRPGNAVFVPPPADRVADCMAALERFLNDQPERTPTLIKAALTHAQFETIHPFLDGNGRVGRLLVTLILCHERVLREPMLYLSLYFKTHRDRYYDLLQGTRKDGGWEAWLAFFVQAVRETARQAVKTADRLAALVREDRERIRALGRLAGSALRLHHVLLEKPILSIPAGCQAAGLVPNTVGKVMDRLASIGLVKELTGRKRNRMFSYHRYLKILSEGTEPLR